jgi:lipopolysaccharide export system permease protein
MLRSNFSKQVIRMDLSDFKMVRSDENLFKDSYQMLNINQLSAERDTQRMEIEEKYARLYQELVTNVVENKQRNYEMQKPENPSSQPLFTTTENFLKKLEPNQRTLLFENTLNIIRSNEAIARSNAEEIRIRKETYTNYGIEFHKKFTLPFACLVLFFIGAPLGAIIKKGGLGMPVVVSVGFFLIFYVLSIVGEKSAKEGAISAMEGAWLASVILLPVGIFLTYKATRDSVLFDMDAYRTVLKKILKKHQLKKHQLRKQLKNNLFNYYNILIYFFNLLNY